MHACDFQIQGLSECIEVSSKRKILTKVLPVTREIVGKILKKDGWSFDWKKEFKLPDRHLFYLGTCMEDQRVQGIISATPMIKERFIFLNLIENAPHNLGSKKQYEGIAVNLVAYICKASFELGLNGYIVFIAKTAMIDH
jgi:hypothetical protein